ncbi:MAG: biotin carboxylase N-terminal domain-containing protein [Ilumatobacter sp.]|uniref:ATP-binding protein n=1 Tax=Ilumatobacter sp. TaxID=1967498 RepID=UPI00262ECB3A|nr:carboxyl transferase domain-containing protein [Ilumatobacter sp.]MDJ0768067.1 biotin carboxylase N-terminal domain-containing protein [Ilumatobacter sp.]
MAMTRQFRRLAIVNRGEPAVRVINAVEEFNAENDTAITTIALYTDPDRAAMFVRRADEAIGLGPATFTDADGHREVAYLDRARLRDALVQSGADAVWAGWGFVSERPAFVDLCDELDITFIGPSAAVMRELGDKISSKQMAESAGVPVAPWSNGPVETVADARLHAERLGLPCLIKATAGGGGRGIRRVESLDELDAAFESARAEALNAFGDGTVFLETLLPQAKHIEVQIVGDSAGTVWAVGVRDCSVQRRNQKLLEEAPSPSLTPEQHREVRAAAARLGAAAGYVNAGTVEFLFDPMSERFSFMEVNARLQVEHPVTEVTTGIDMVKLQLHIARGGLLEGDAPPTVGHAIEARINAEDPDAGFAPSPGRIDLLRLPAGPGIRVDTGVEEGDHIPAEFDSMIAKVIAVGRDRDEALARLRRGLDNTAIVIAGGASNRAFLRSLLHEPEVIDATADVGWVDRRGSGLGASALHADVAIMAAAVDAHRQQMAVERRQFQAMAARGRPEVDTAVGRRVELRYRGQTYAATVQQFAPETYGVTIQRRSVLIHRVDAGHGSSRLEIRGQPYRVLTSMHGAVHLVEVNGHPHHISHDDGGIVRAKSPAVVVSIEVEPGDEVAAGDRLAVIEAMKMETVIEAEFAGRVEQVVASPNSHVVAGAPLLTVRPTEDAESADGARIEFEAIASPGQFAHADCRHHLDAIRQGLLGFDVDPTVLRVMSNPGATPCSNVLTDDERRRYEDELVGIFTDVIALFRRGPAGADDATRTSAEEYLFDYLLHRETLGRDLPERFLDQLRRALAHYGVDDLEPSTRLDVALHRLVLSHHRMDDQLAPVLRILEDRLEHTQPGEGDEQLRELLDRLLDESRSRYPALHDLAEELRYQVFDAPFLAEVRDRELGKASNLLDELATSPPPERRAELIGDLVDCSQPLKSTLSQRFPDANPALQGAALEVMTRRYYRIRNLHDVRVETVDGLRYVTAEYDHQGRRIHVVTTHVDLPDMASAAQRLAPAIEAIDDGHDVALDFYALSDSAGLDEERVRDELAGTLGDALGRFALRRIVVAVSGPDVPASQHTMGVAGVMHFTFRPDGANGYIEEALYRDLHPMMGKRLELQRLDAFDVHRIPSTEGVYVFHGHARENRRDERLFALAEVRDLTPIRDEDGNVERLPEAERVIHEILGAFRRFQSHRPASKRLLSNRIVLYVWPIFDLSADDIAQLVERLMPDAAGLGLEKVEVLANFRGDHGEPERLQLEVTRPNGTAPTVLVRPPSVDPIRPLERYEQQVVRLRQRGLTYPYEIVRMLTPDDHRRPGIPPGDFVEYDLADSDADGDGRPRLVAVDRPPGGNSAHVVVGIVTNRTERYPEGIRRVIILGDPSSGMGNLSEPECSRIIAAFDLADSLGVPLEWFAVSAGALISMDSGSENMDWIGKVLRRIVEFTQAGGEVNIVITGINVGAQPYWNAEATMLMHTRGILIMVPEAAMVLTGKEALDFSGGVSADDNIGIGGYERIMGPNGQAQYFANDVADACRQLLAHYDFTYVAPDERFARPAKTDDPFERDISVFAHGGQFERVGDIFDDALNPDRKLPFEIRKLMAAVVDQDRPTMERWPGMRDAEIPVSWDAFLGGRPIALLGFESKNLTRRGFVPSDGPDHWTSGTLFPSGSRKVARTINAASGNRPLVVLANLSGFDGSPESMRERQLEFGAEIGRAMVNFDGPIVFCVVSRYHGGAFVVFSGTLNDNLEVAALEGSKASVIGGAPAAAVVFAREVRTRVEADERVQDLEHRLAGESGATRAKLRRELAALREQIHAEKMRDVADEFDRRHDINRAQRVGSVDVIIPPSELRPYLIGAVERGIARAS